MTPKSWRMFWPNWTCFEKMISMWFQACYRTKLDVRVHLLIHVICFSVKSLREKLDKDQLGLILRSDFLSEFFPHTNKFNNSKPFSVYHYNGLLRNGDIPVRTTDWFICLAVLNSWAVFLGEIPSWASDNFGGGSWLANHRHTRRLRKRHRLWFCNSQVSSHQVPQSTNCLGR